MKSVALLLLSLPLIASAQSEPSLQQALNQSGFTTNVGTDAVNKSYFSAGSYTLTDLFQYAGYAPNAKVGVFSKGDPSDITWLLGTGNTGLASTATYSASSSFGVVLDSGDHGGNNDSLYYSSSKLNSGDQHLKLYTTSVGGKGVLNDYVGGFEDQPLSASDKDYNDFGLRIQKGTPAVPEPMTFLGVGIAAIALVSRKRRVKTI